MLIDFIGENENALVLFENIGQLRIFIFAINGACRIGWGIEHQPAGFGRNCRCKPARGQFETSVRSARHEDRFAAMQRDNISIGYPAWRGDDHFIPFFQRCQKRVEQYLLGAVGHGQFIDAEFKLVVAAELGNDGLAKRFRASSSTITHAPGFHRRMDGIQNVGRRFKIGFTQRKINNVPALGAQFPGAMETAMLGDALMPDDRRFSYCMGILFYW